MSAKTKRRVVIVNQVANYLTVDLANAFARKLGNAEILTERFCEPLSPIAPSVSVNHLSYRYRQKPSRLRSEDFLTTLRVCLKIYWTILTRYRKAELIFISNPPPAYLLSLLVPNRCSIMIWDLYPDSLKIKGIQATHPIYRLWSWLNRQAFGKAYKVFTIGEVLAQSLDAYIARNKVIVHPLWASFIGNSRVRPEANSFITSHGLAGKFVVQYSGNIGLTQNVETIIDLAERLASDSRIVFQIIGHGRRAADIAEVVEKRKLPNLQLLPFQENSQFLLSLSAANLGVVVLDEKVSRGGTPSKAFNLMRLGIPSLYITAPDSQLANYAERYGHAKCFTAQQLDDIVAFVKELVESPDKQLIMSNAAVKASEHFLPCNADLIVQSYLDTE